jgi:hypothetical protein
LSIFAVAALAVVFIPSALGNSVKSQTFELDGNIAQDHPAAPTTYDWANFFDSSGAQSPVLPDATRLGYTASTFVRDFNTAAGKKPGSIVFDTSDSSTYTIGSKDILDVNGWSCTPANNVTDKGDIMNAYAVAYTAPGVGGHKFMFFGLERNANAGDANVAFWFLQGKASCPAAGGSFTGTHHNGDLLMVSAFTNGGSVSNINVYEWQNGALNTTPVANGGDCRNGTLTGDPTCATSNTAPINNIPWLTENKADGVGHTLQTGEFFEGGVDLSAPSVNLANNCFNTFIPDTRSSQSLTATLYDYAVGQLGECKTNLTTTHGDTADTPENDNGIGGAAASPTSIGTGSVSSGTDTAALQVTGVGSWDGTLTFYLCGPTSAPASGKPACHDAQGNQTGVQVSSVNVSETDNNSHNFVSGAAALTSAGTYCWTAHFEPSSTSSDNGVLAADDTGANECFTVAKANPALTTCSGSYAAGVCTPSDAVAFGNAIHDYGNLTGLATEPGSNGANHGGNANWPTINATDLSYAGSIAFTLKGPANSGCGVTTSNSTTVGDTNPQSVAVNSTTGNGVYGPVSYTPGSPGKYHWQASMDDLSNAIPPVELSVNNVLPANENNANCTDTNEDVTVQQIPTSISTTQKVYPQDSATIASTGSSSDLLPAGGTVSFSLYGNGADAAANLANCQAGAATGRIYTRSFSTNDGLNGHPVPAHSETFGTDNTTVAVSDNETVYWLVTYATGDQAHTGRQSQCLESTQTVFVNDSSGGTLFP